MYRNFLFLAWLTAVAGLAGPPTFAQPSVPAPDMLRSMALLEFELVDEQNNPLTKTAQKVRLRQATLQLRQALAERQLYTLTDPVPSQTLQDRLRIEQAFFYRCDDCAAQVGKRLGVELVMTPWVQKVSELILNLNVQVDVRAGKPIFSKSVDMRGNTDESWRRAVFYLVRDMAEKRARNPNYGQ
jgi:hypothetical protein